MTKVHLITGAAGQDGLILSRRLGNQGEKVVALVRTKQQMQTIKFYAPGADAIVVDLSNRQELRSIFATFCPKYVYNLAARSSVSESWSTPGLTWESNYETLRNVIEAASSTSAGSSVKIYQASSSEMFGTAGLEKLDENSPLNPTSPYAKSKAASHIYVAECRERGQFTCSGILFNHESPLRNEKFVIRKITKAAASIKLGMMTELKLGEINVGRDWGWAPDYVTAIQEIIGAEYPSDYVVATGVQHSLTEVLETCFEYLNLGAWGKYVSHDESLIRPEEISRSVGNADRIKRELGWAPSRLFPEVLREMIDFDLQQLSTASNKTWFEN